MKRFLIFLAFVPLAFGQSKQAPQSYVAGRFVAFNYSQWSIAPYSMPSGTGAKTFVVSTATVRLPDGRFIMPFNTNAPIFVGTEQVTPSAVTNCVLNGAANTCSITATFSSSHKVSDYISSATYGLQEALNDAGNFGGAVTVDGSWAAAGGTTAIKNAATLPSNTGIEDVRTGANGGGSGTVSDGANYAGGMYASGAGTTIGPANTITDTYTASSNYGYMNMIINGLNPSTEFIREQGAGNYAVLGQVSGVAVPIGSTNYQSNALSSFLTDLSPTTYAVAGYFQATCLQTGTGDCWGANSTVRDVSGFTGQLIAHETDVTVNGSPAAVYGVASAGGFYNVTPIGQAFRVSLFGGPGQWLHGLYVTDGSAEYAVKAGAANSASGASSSQPIQFASKNSGNTELDSTIYTDAAGDIVLNPHSGVVISPGGSSFGTKLTSYNFSIVETPLAYGGVFTAGGTGDSLPKVPSAGVCEPQASSVGYAAIATGWGTWPASQSSTITIGNFTSGLEILLVRQATGTNTHYEFDLQPGASSQTINAVVAGTNHALTSFTATPANGDVWTFTVVGTTPILNVYQNGVLVGTVTDSTYGASISSGSPGFALYTPEAVTTATISTWSGGTL